MTMIENPVPTGDPMPPSPGKTQPLPPEMPVPGMPSPEDVPPQPSHPGEPPAPTARAIP